MALWDAKAVALVDGQQLVITVCLTVIFDHDKCQSQEKPAGQSWISHAQHESSGGGRAVSCEKPVTHIDPISGYLSESDQRVYILSFSWHKGAWD